MRHASAKALNDGEPWLAAAWPAPHCFRGLGDAGKTKMCQSACQTQIGRAILDQLHTLSNTTKLKFA
jgi:hypothetical protein